MASQEAPYKTNPKKYSGFISHIKGEAEQMKQIRENVLNETKSTNAVYSHLTNRSTKVIYGAPPKTTSTTQKSSPSKLPKLIPRSQTKQETRSVINVLEPNSENNYNFPKRKTAASRIYNPDRLKIYDIGHREKDIAVLSGARFSEESLITI